MATPQRNVNGIERTTLMKYTLKIDCIQLDTLFYTLDENASEWCIVIVF